MSQPKSSSSLGGKSKMSSANRNKNKTLSSLVVEYVNNPSVRKSVGVATAIVACTAYAFAQSRWSVESATESARGPKPIPREEVQQLYKAAIDSLSRKSSESTPGGPGDDQSTLTPEFIALYDRIEHAAPPEEYEDDIRCTIAEFLIVHSRFENIAFQLHNPLPLSSLQANKIRRWVSFETEYGLPDVNLKNFANKIDILYRVATAQKSMTDLRRLYEWMTTAFPRIHEPTDTTDSTFYAIYVQHRFLIACQFGLWDEVDVFSKPLENIILPRSRMKLRQSFTQRAMGRPHVQCNYNQIIINLDSLRNRFPKALQPPPRYERWPIKLTRYRRIGNEGAGHEGDASGNGGMDDEHEWKYFIEPGGSGVGAQEIVKHMYIFGSCVQFISPERGHSGNLPVTGAWNDSELNATMEWTFSVAPRNQQGNDRSLGVYVRKSVEIDLERIGHTSMEEVRRGIECKDGEEIPLGWVWKGTMQVEVKQGRPNMMTSALDFGEPTREVNEFLVVMESRD